MVRIKLNHTVTKRKGYSFNYFCEIDGITLPQLYVSQTAPVQKDGILEGDIYPDKLTEPIKALAFAVHDLVSKFNKGEDIPNDRTSQR